MEPTTPEPAASTPEPESKPPIPDPPATIPKPASTFTIKPIKIPQFIAEIWFLCRAFARFSPITHSISSCCEQGGVTGVGLQLLNHDSRQFLAAVQIAPKDLECKRAVTFETLKIFMIFQDSGGCRGEPCYCLDHVVSMLIFNEDPSVVICKFRG